MNETLDTTNETLYEEYIKENFFPINIESDPSKISKSLQAKIQSISNRGKMMIEFN